jgi:protein gp37
MQNSHIEWCDNTINFMIGCDKVSEGCDNCYADDIENHYGRDFTVFWGTDWSTIIDNLRKWKGGKIFANSMTDMFHDSVPDFMIQSMFKVFKKFKKHQFQVLTKRPKRMMKFTNKFYKLIPDNVWLGTSIELQKYTFRLDYLKKTYCKTKFVSFEPLLGEITNVNLEGIHQAIIGGESGHHARPMKKEWIYTLAKQIKEQNVALFFKQWGGNKKCPCHDSKGCCLIDGVEYKEYPLLVQPKQGNEKI